MTIESGQDRFTRRPGRGFVGGAVTGVWLALVLGATTLVLDGIASGWRLGLVAVAAGDLVGTLVVAVPVLTLVGGVVRSSPRVTAVVAYAGAAVLVRVLLGPLAEAAVGSAPVRSGGEIAVTAAVALLSGVVAAALSTRDRLPHTTGLLRFRVGGRPVGGGVPGPSAAPAPAGRYLSGGL